MSSTGTMTSRSSCLRTPASTIETVLSTPPKNRANSSSGRCVADRPMRCGWRPRCRLPAASAVAHNRSRRSRLNARCAPRLVAATAWISSMITCSIEARMSRARREHQVERLGSRDEDVGRLLAQRPALLLGRVASAGANSNSARAHAGQRRPQVALHVVGEGLERRYVEHPAAFHRVGRRWRGDQPVEGPEERGQCLARARGGQDQRVVALADGVPALLLGRRRGREGGREPVPSGRREPVESRGIGHGPRLRGRVDA